MATALPSPAATQVRDRITLRSILIGLALSVVFSLIVPYVDVFMSDTFLGSCHLPPGAVFVLLVLVLVVNPLLRLISRRAPLSRVELLMIYCMLLFSTLTPGHGAENVFIPVAITPYYYANPANDWQHLFFDYIPAWFAPSGRGAVLGFFEGLRRGQPIPWGAWLKPLLAWSVYSAAVYALVLFLAVLFRSQWNDREKISFPLVELPMRMTESPYQPFARGSFYRNSGMWIGFAVAVFLAFMNGMHFYYPQWPAIAMQYNFRPWAWGHPWRAVGWIPGRIWPAVVGTTVLLRTEVSLSLWLFYWLNKAQLVVAAAVGYHGASFRTAWGRPQWLGLQPVGGYLAYVGYALWVARGHLAHVWQRLRGRGEPEPKNEALPYAFCAWGLIVSLGVMVMWGMFAGQKWWFAAGQSLVYVVLAIALTKVVAEAGLLFVQSTLSGVELLSIFAGQRSIGASSLTIGIFLERSYMFDMRAFVMPSFSQSFKIADLTGMNRRTIAWVTSLTILIATVICYYVILLLVYTYSGLKCNPWFIQGAGPGGFRLLASYLQNPQEVRWQALSWLSGGAGFLLLLFYIRQRVAWFPVHPVGFIMSQTYPMSQLWFSIFLGWVAKSVILRYGGPKGVRNLIPIFLGIAFGDIVMMVVWLIVDALTGTHGHYLMPG